MGTLRVDGQTDSRLLSCKSDEQNDRTAARHLHSSTISVKIGSTYENNLYDKFVYDKYHILINNFQKTNAVSISFGLYSLQPK